MAKKEVDPKLVKAAGRLAKYLGAPVAAAASSAVSTLMTIFASVLVPVLAEALTELLNRKDARKKYGKFLIPAREVLNDADLGDK